MEGRIFSLAVFLSLRQIDLIRTSPVIDCDKYKYKVQHQYQPYCMACLICPASAESKHHNAACKKKIPNSVPGQGYAWCTGVKDRSPWCPQLTVQYGRLNCSKGNGVYSTCRLLCDFGYKPENSSWTEPKCLESLQWSIPDQSILRCQRTAKPDKPSVSSLGQRPEVKAGSDKTLQCIPAAHTVGKRKIYWYFKDKQLYSDSDLDIYVIHGTSKDREGEYFCQVEDEIGKSELSAGFYLKVEELHTKHQTDMELVFAVLLAVSGVVILGCLYWKRAKIYACSLVLWHRIPSRQQHEEKINSCLSSVESSMSGSSQSSGTTHTTDSGSSDKDSTFPLLTVTPEKRQPPQFIVEADKLEILESKSLLVLETEISDSDNRVSLLPLASAIKDPALKDGEKDPALKDAEKDSALRDAGRYPALKDGEKDPALKDAVKDSAMRHPVNSTLPRSCTRNEKTIETGRINIAGINSTDQEALRLVFKDCRLMKKIITLLDQKAEINQNKPTFHSLGRFLGDSPDEVSHFEFRCQHKELSPTEGYIKRMIEEGQGLSNLLTFLKQHKHTQDLAENIEKKSHLHHTSAG